MSILILFVVFSLGALQAPQKAVANMPDLVEARKLHEETARLYKEEKFAEALEPAKKVVALREKHLPPNDILIANSYKNLGYILRSLGKYYDAERALKKALKVEENRLGKEHGELAELLISIGWLVHAQNNPLDAESFFKRAVLVTEKNYGAEHKEVAEQLYHLARFYEKTAKPGKAVAQFNRMIAIRVKAFGENSPDTKEAVELNACALEQNKQEAEAQLEWQRAQKIERVLHPKIGQVEAGVLQGYALKRVQPEYPVAASAARLQGIIIILVIINEAGDVDEARTLCGPDLLAPASVEAAKQWKFKPTLLNGKPVKVQGHLKFNFIR